VSAVAPGATYDTIGCAYSRHRRPDPRIAHRLWSALGSARSILDVGAGTGSYEPVDRSVVAVDPSAVMLDQRPHDAEAYLDAEVRSCISMLAELAPEQVDDGIAHLADDLASGAWARRHADLLDRVAVDGGYRILVAE
jgi:SAM-dependent methyltransferase